MILSDKIKPISYFKTHASEVIRDVSENQKTMIITQNGEAKVILQDIKLYEKTQENLALLKILALSSKNLKKGKVKPLEKAFDDVQKRIKHGTNRSSFISGVPLQTI
jgi:prevent-host-death family protein